MPSTVPGSRKIHHLRILGPGVLASRQLYCFCVSCMAGQLQLCSSPDHIDAWETVKVKYSGPASVLPRCEQPQQMNGGRSDTSLSSAEEPDSGSQSGTESPIIPESHAGGESPVISDSSQSIVSEPDDEERIPFFESVAAELAECENFFEVQKVSRHLTEQLERFPLPESSTFNLAGCQIDSNATRLLQPEI